MQDTEGVNILIWQSSNLWKFDQSSKFLFQWRQIPRNTGNLLKIVIWPYEKAVFRYFLGFIFKNICQAQNNIGFDIPKILISFFFMKDQYNLQYYKKKESWFN